MSLLTWQRDFIAVVEVGERERERQTERDIERHGETEKHTERQKQREKGGVGRGNVRDTETEKL